MSAPSTPEIVLNRFRLALARGDRVAIVTELSAMLPADRADVFLDLTPEEQQTLLPLLDVRASAEVFEELDGDDAVELARYLPSETLALVLDEMSPDTAADILGDMTTEQATSALMQMEEPEDVAQLLQYRDDTAGGLMTSDFIVFHPDTTAQEAIDRLRAEASDSNSPYYLYVTEHDGKLLGVIGLRGLITAKPDAMIRDFMGTRIISVHVETDQEGVANLMKRYRLSLLPVVNSENVLLGIIFSDDIVYVLEDEATEDLLRLSNVSDSFLEVWSPVTLSIRKRLPWLFLNLFTAFLAASVVNIFESTITKLAVLAAFLGMIAGQGGNAGTQTLALMVRGIAVGELELSDTWKVLTRELFIGLVNGLAIGTAVGVFAYYWKGIPILGVIVGISMVGNMIAAAIAGTLVPLGLKALKLDPALASAVLVTTVTDSIGFGLFLWLATTYLPSLT